MASNLGSFGGANNAYTYSDNPMWQFSDALSYIRGAHTLTVGADYKRWTLYRGNAGNFLGEYTFSDGTATGNEVADFLLGYYGAANGFLPAPFAPPNSAGNLHDYNFQYGAAFLQDDWKVNDKLTLNLGLRWDIRPIPYDAHNRFTWLDTTNPNGGLCFADPALATDGVAPAGNGYYRYCGTNHPGKNRTLQLCPALRRRLSPGPQDGGPRRLRDILGWHRRPGNGRLRRCLSLYHPPKPVARQWSIKLPNHRSTLAQFQQHCPCSRSPTVRIPSLR